MNFVLSQHVLILIMLNIWFVSTTKYYLSHDDIKKRLDHHHHQHHYHHPSSSSSTITTSTTSKSSLTPAGGSSTSTNNNNKIDRIQTANSNLFYIEDSGDSHELIGTLDYGHHSMPHDTFYMTSEKKNTKLFTEEISFVIAVVTLAVFLCFLSSVFIPLAVLFFNGGGLLPLGGLNNLFPMTNTITAGSGIGSMVMAGRRKKRSNNFLLHPHDDINLFDTYLTRFYSALNKFG